MSVVRLILEQQLWQKRKYDLSGDAIAIDYGRTLLESLRRILQDEIQAPAPHSCIATVASSRIYVTVIRIASASYDEGLVREALKLLNILIDCEEEEFLQDQGFADALTAFLLENASTGSRMIGVDTEVELVEVLFSIAAKLRLQPEILPVWFKPQIQHWEGGSGAAMAKLHKREFPLFYLLLDQVHHDGGIGDFARTGLLYILGTASHSENLERWIIESDVATLMASGLGAVYSQLTRYCFYDSFLLPTDRTLGSLFCRILAAQSLKLLLSPTNHSLLVPAMPMRQALPSSRRILQPFFLIWSFGKMSWNIAHRLILNKPC